MKQGVNVQSISLGLKAQKLLSRRMKRGGYSSAETAIVAGLATLDQQESLDGFAPGELEGLLATADEDIRRGRLMDGEASLRNRLRRRGERAKKSK